MHDPLRDLPVAGSRPLHLVGESELDAWLATLLPSEAQWLRSMGFRAESHRVASWPAADGRPAGAVLGLGRLAAETLAAPWPAAGLFDRLPDGDWEIVTSLAREAATHVLLGFGLGAYRFDRFRKIETTRRTVTLAGIPGVDLGRIRRLLRADAWARDLINTPAGDLGPADLAAAARQLAAQHGASFREVVGDDLIAAGLPLVHGVGRAGSQPPRLVDLGWGDPAKPLVGLVGKGVCFDSGGLDLKPAAGMALMKKDMGGAAIALALADLIMGAGLPVRLRVIVPAVENAIGPAAVRPGDVLQSRKGLSVEIGNTDAEGRLVLADGLALVDADEPDLLIDLATLTGAARVALGPELPALFCADDDLCCGLLAAGRAAGDPLWRLPLWAGYDDELSSKVADLGNVSATPFAGAILGALFLQRFVSRARNWVHLDLYAWNGKDRPGRPVGAEAQTLRALFTWIESRYAGG
ncbi:MAG: leucyl aminopeptidase family protein [Steroidobacteraceae bacterium]